MPKSTETVQFIRGEVGAGGSVVSGLGFSISKAATGVYRINYDVAFGGLPTVVTSPVNTSGVIVSATTTAEDSSTTRVNVIDNAGAAIDSGFTFITCGPN